MVVLHIVAPAVAGGLERVVQALAAGHQRGGHRVAVAGVVTPGQAEPPLFASLRETRVEVCEVQVPCRRYLRERAAIGELCHALHPDVVHTHGYRPDIVDAGVARRRGIPIVTTVHGFTGGDWKNRLYERLQLRAFRRFDAVVAVSRPLSDQLAREGVPRTRIHLVPNAWPGGTNPCRCAPRAGRPRRRIQDRLGEAILARERAGSAGASPGLAGRPAGDGCDIGRGARAGRRAFGGCQTGRGGSHRVARYRA